jgi:hypothetical protein
VRRGTRHFAFGRYDEDGQFSGQVKKQKNVTDVYCCESDKFETFTLKQGIEATGVFKQQAGGGWGYTDSFMKWFGGNDGKHGVQADYNKADNMDRFLERDGKFNDLGKQTFMPCMYYDDDNKMLTRILYKNETSTFPGISMFRCGYSFVSDVSTTSKPAVLCCVLNCFSFSKVVMFLMSHWACDVTGVVLGRMRSQNAAATSPLQRSRQHETSSAFAVTNPKGRLRRRTLYLFVVLFCLVQEGEDLVAFCVARYAMLVAGQS